MKIVFTGGGSGGHFYPLIAVAQSLNRMIGERKLLPPRLYFFSNTPFDPELLATEHLTYQEIPAGKLRLYASKENIFDMFRTVLGSLKALWKCFVLYPDVVFSKGGFGSFPTILATRILGIPVVIHESDSVPGRVNAFAGKFARRVGVAFKEAALFFPLGRVAYIGNPIRRELLAPDREHAFDRLHLEVGIPTILVLGGSLGATLINERVLQILSDLLNTSQVIHQTGKEHIGDIEKEARITLETHSHKNRYHPYAYLDLQTLRLAAGAADLVISRAGSTIFEIAAWGVPALLIPISQSNGDHQRQNAYNYARGGGAKVIEEDNFSHTILRDEIMAIISDSEKKERMKAAALSFAMPDAADRLAEEILSIALSHEK